jgi:hypothetical protein
MNSAVFTHLAVLEVIVCLLTLAVTRAWRRIGPRLLSVVGLLAVVFEGLVVVLHGHPTPLGQFLAFVAIAAVGTMICVDEKTRVQLVRRRPQRR